MLNFYNCCIPKAWKLTGLIKKVANVILFWHSSYRWHWRRVSTSSNLGFIMKLDLSAKKISIRRKCFQKSSACGYEDVLHVFDLLFLSGSLLVLFQVPVPDGHTNPRLITSSFFGYERNSTRFHFLVVIWRFVWTLPVFMKSVRSPCWCQKWNQHLWNSENHLSWIFKHFLFVFFKHFENNESFCLFSRVDWNTFAQNKCVCYEWWWGKALGGEDDEADWSFWFWR